MKATGPPVGWIRSENQPNILVRMLAANTLAHMPKCWRGVWQGCGRAATHASKNKEFDLPENEYLRCEDHVIELGDNAEALPSRSHVLELERIAWSK
jgi:hypothetical protein